MSVAVDQMLLLCYFNYTYLSMLLYFFDFDFKWVLLFVFLHYCIVTFTEVKHLNANWKSLFTTMYNDNVKAQKVFFCNVQVQQPTFPTIPLNSRLARLEKCQDVCGCAISFENLHGERRRGGERQRSEQNTQWRRRRQRQAERVQADRPPARSAAGPQWDEKRTVARPRNSGKVQRPYPSLRRCGSGSESTTRRWASCSCPPLISMKARVPLAQWSADVFASCSHTKQTIAKAMAVFLKKKQRFTFLRVTTRTRFV